MVKVRKLEEADDAVPGADVMMVVMPMSTWERIKDLAKLDDCDPATLISRALSQYAGDDDERTG